MKRLYSGFFLVLLGVLVALPARAALEVFATVPEWAALTREIGGDQVNVFAATHALQDPHRIEAKPSLLARARRANLVVAVGADLEIGWLPLVLRESANPAIQPGKPGYFEAAALVPRLEIPAVVDRAQGDVHPAGNPHVHLDPRLVLKVGEGLTARLAELDPAHADTYKANFRQFSERWRAAMVAWEKRAAPLRGQAVLVHHRSFSYLLAWLGLKEAGTLEPKPGVEPSSGHLNALLSQAQGARLVLRAAYQSEGASQWLASRSTLRPVLLPYTVGGTPEAKDLFALFDDTLSRLLKGLE